MTGQEVMVLNWKRVDLDYVSGTFWQWWSTGTHCPAQTIPWLYDSTANRTVDVNVSTILFMKIKINYIKLYQKIFKELGIFLQKFSIGQPTPIFFTNLKVNQVRPKSKTKPRYL